MFSSPQHIIILAHPQSKENILRLRYLQDGRRVVEEERRIFVRDGRLEIAELKATDEGEYKCVATNDEGTAERSARISFAS